MSVGRGRVIFMSYARTERRGSNGFRRPTYLGGVASLYDDLKSQGWKPWMDVRDIPAGTDWARAIERAIDSSNAFLFLLPDEFSKAMRQEASRALSRRIPILPVVRMVIVAGRPERADRLLSPYWLQHVQALEDDQLSYPPIEQALVRLIGR
jgi:hypothetical protein